MNAKLLAAVVILVIAVLLAFGYLRMKPRVSGPEAPGIPPGNISHANFSATALGNVKVAIVYERLNDARPKRTIGEQIKILKDTKADMIFRASWRWNPLPNSCSAGDIAKVTGKQPQDVTPQVEQICTDSGYSFEGMKNTVSAIKKEMPNIIIIGGVPAQKIGKSGEINEVTGETFDANQTWQMALDPAKWGITSTTKEKLQESLQKAYVADGYYPDITNARFQELLLSWAKRQIDSGMDGIWIDLLYTQAETLQKITKDPNHPAVKESSEAASKIIDEIHSYGKSKGKYVYVGTWNVLPNLDFTTKTPINSEVSNRELDDARWDDIKSRTEKAAPNIPIFVFIDWAGDAGQTALLSKMSPSDQSKFITTADGFFTSKGMTFIYPVHGGNAHSSVLIFGQKSAWYDSLAPEMGTYDTIKQLAQAKSGR